MRIELKTRFCAPCHVRITGTYLLVLGQIYNMVDNKSFTSKVVNPLIVKCMKKYFAVFISQA